MSHQHRAVQLRGKIREGLERRIGRGQTRIEIGDTLLCQLVDGGQRELTVREGLPGFESESEVGPNAFVGRVNSLAHRPRFAYALARWGTEEDKAGDIDLGAEMVEQSQSKAQFKAPAKRLQPPATCWACWSI